jgi:hypothetical protein
LGDGGARRFLKRCGGMGGGGGPIQDGATRREMGGPVGQQGRQSAEASGGSVALSRKVAAREVRTGGVRYCVGRMGRLF